jgi:polysaccharide pyruvyl transferase WcaK-like protein
MRKIVILDTWVNDTNLGNKFIMEAVYRELREIFPHDFFYQVPALEYVQAGRRLVKQADYVFLAGTNLLRSDMQASEWRLRIMDIFWMRNVILVGVGWWQYQVQSPNLYTRLLLRRILGSKYYHSVRDSYTASKLKALGFKVLNTGCPTLWRLSEEHCAAIPRTKAENALLTFTEYNQRPDYDRIIFEIVKRNYATIYFWPQMFGDYHYAKTICGNTLTFVDPSIEALDELLRTEDVDYIGTRLHAGIRALQHKRRAIIVAIDNRAIEMGKDFNLPIVLRDEIGSKLKEKIKGNWATEVKIDQQAIIRWKRQFCDSNTA